ncbi:MAG: NAD(P)-dependent oxidoreductase [Cyanobacteria bacterium REEB67]|nr:NAD(P)-dependent oxidoreductase [Cyanobacteria bacterium REEB67]
MDKMPGKVLLTGGAGDLAQILIPELLANDFLPSVIDVRPPSDKAIAFTEASILDREALDKAVAGCEMIIHIAAWHGIHDFRKEHDAYDFWDLNATGTFNVFEAAARAGIKKMIFLSSTSVNEPYGLYGHTKIIGEEIARAYYYRHDMKVITLRPRAFIPHWNATVYKNYIEWAKYFWLGAVHINDVSQAVYKSAIRLTSGKPLNEPLTLVVDGAYEYTSDDLANWDKDGPGSTFKRHYGQYYDVAVADGLDPSLRPNKLDHSLTTKEIGYKPEYSLKSLLEELAKFGAAGPPGPSGSSVVAKTSV